eukprot:292453-Rhodomonas_salina.2
MAVMHPALALSGEMAYRPTLRTRTPPWPLVWAALSLRVPEPGVAGNLRQPVEFLLLLDPEPRRHSSPGVA